MRKRFILLVLAAVFLLASFPVSASDHAGYTLDRVVVLSRHNIRSPMSGSGSLLGEITPHEWFEWTSNPSELSLRGGILETLMGQYFRLWLEEEGLIPENYRPEDGAVRFYANSKQRTIATAQYFSAGFLPVAGVPVEYHAEYDVMDPVFTPKLTFVSDAYAEDVAGGISELGGEDGLQGIQDGLHDAIALLMEITDMEESEAYRAGRYGDLFHGENTVNLELDKELSMTGPIRTATSVADALTLQYYEEPDALRASFGHAMTEEDWKLLHSIVDTYTEMLFASPLVSVHVAHPLLEELRSELTAEGRTFSFLCGHDSNIASVLSALETEEYDLPGTVEPKTPIGVKLVFERYLDAEEEAYYRVSLVYQSTQQLREPVLMTLDNPPMKVPVRFKDVPVNADGMISESDLLARFGRAIDAYDFLLEEYVPEEVLAPAA